MADRPLTRDQLLDVLRRSVPRAWWESVSVDPSFALFRGSAAALAACGRAMIRSVEARYRLPSSRQLFDPASGARKAAGTATLTRAGSAAEAFLAGVGQIPITAAGRTYLNTEPVLWEPGDRGTRVVPYECDAAGFPGNLDMIPSAVEGQLPDGMTTFRERSFGRTGVAGSIITGGAQTLLQDTGFGDTFRAEDLGLYVLIVASSVAANVGQVRRIVGYQRVGDVGQAALDDLVRRTAMELVVGDATGPTFTDRTMEGATEGTTWELFPAVPAVGDAVYFGHSSPFGGVDLHIETAGVGDWELAYEYWNGSTWVALTAITDTTANLQASGLVGIRWTVPSNWAALSSVASTGVSPFYARARITALTEPSPEPPVAGRVVVLVPSPLTADAGAVTWQIADAADLSIAIGAVTAFSGGRDDDLYVLGDDRGVYRMPGETEDQFRDRLTRLPDVVTPAAVQRHANRAIRPSGYRAKVLDVGADWEGGFTGMFMDVDAADYYEPGDAFPTDPFKVPLSYDYAHGGGWVYLPWLGLGDFGMGADDGPVVPGGMAPAGPGASAADAGFLDGEPVDSNGLYAAVWAAVDRARTPGVVFELVRDESLNVLGC